MALSTQQKYYQDNKEKIKARSKEWAKNNPHKVTEAQKKFAKNNKEKELERVRKYRKKNPIKTMLRAAKQRARNKDLEFGIEESDIAIPETCPLLGIPIEIDSENKWVRPSLDRIDSAKGYVRGNIQVTSWRANMIKNNALAEELLTIGYNLMRIQESA